MSEQAKAPRVWMRWAVALALVSGTLAGAIGPAFAQDDPPAADAPAVDQQTGDVVVVDEPVAVEEPVVEQAPVEQVVVDPVVEEVAPEPVQDAPRPAARSLRLRAPPGRRDH